MRRSQKLGIRVFQQIIHLTVKSVRVPYYYLVTFQQTKYIFHPNLVNTTLLTFTFLPTILSLSLLSTRRGRKNDKFRLGQSIGATRHAAHQRIIAAHRLVLLPWYQYI